MEGEPSVCAVIVGYENVNGILSSAHEVLNSSYRNLFVLAINNGRQKRREVVREGATSEFVNTGSNLGFASACNVGARLALSRGFNFILFMNDDVLLERGCVSKMVAEMVKRPKVGLLCPVVLDHSGSVESAGDRFNGWFGLSLHNANGRRFEDVCGTSPRVDFAPLVASMVRAEALKEVGFMDERYFMYVEDIDLSIRVKDAGHLVSCLTETFVRHASSSTSMRFPGIKQYYMTRNLFLLLRNQRKIAQLVGLAFSLPLTTLIRIVKRRHEIGLPELKGLFRGFKDGIGFKQGPSDREEYRPP
ncbi:MAG: glycosyltransferase family 2 protein [Nitrososphaerota archaeon]|nr:glycosyltransferase family 2 protein [Nitrososphaerota archaeon]MDG6990876.1 glycosyltransferase family 2 protein [Nitrososphaerota archaeon]